MHAGDPQTKSHELSPNVKDEPRREWRDSCNDRKCISLGSFGNHFPSTRRDSPGVGSGALLGLFRENSAGKLEKRSKRKSPFSPRGWIWRPEKVDEHGRLVWKRASNAESFESTSATEYLRLYDVRGRNVIRWRNFPCER